MQEHYGFEHNDPDTIEILDQTCIPKKAIQGTPWYQILSNAKYAHLFNYIGAFVNEREKLIEDGFKDKVDNHGHMTEECKRHRVEQSDLVMILLNLGYIPDSVVHKIHFKQGWGQQFFRDMADFKEEYAQKNGKEWSFQTEETEKEYAEFKKSTDERLGVAGGKSYGIN